jgi:hypothetical protein
MACANSTADQACGNENSQVDGKSTRLKMVVENAPEQLRRRGAAFGRLAHAKMKIPGHELYVIVGLDVALKGPFPLVGESELSRTDPKIFQFI